MVRRTDRRINSLKRPEARSRRDGRDNETTICDEFALFEILTPTFTGRYQINRVLDRDIVVGFVN